MPGAKKSKKKGVAADEQDGVVVCSFTQRIGDAPEKVEALLLPPELVEQVQPVA